LPYSKKAAFAAAGYASITTGAGRTGGAVRQHGLVSFSRVFDAGHEGKRPFASLFLASSW
jgi:carboxypeptidase D